MLGEKIPHLRKKSGKYTGWKFASSSWKKIREISVWRAHSLSDQHSVKSCFVFYFNAVISTMEFPPETYDVVATHVFRVWPRDLKIRRNMTTTAWVDSCIAITANNIPVSTDEKGDPVSPEEIKNMFTSIKEMGMKSGSTCYAVVAGWSIRPTPGTAEALTSKPTFAG